VSDSKASGFIGSKVPLGCLWRTPDSRHGGASGRVAGLQPAAGGGIS